MSTTRLFLTGIGARGRLGANPGEQDVPQDVVVDLDVEVQVGADSLAATADYRSLIRVAREAVAEGSFDLLESLAAAVAPAVASAQGGVRATAIVHKPAAARSNEVQGVAAAFTADAGD
jgi:7,8-dihydroneopterin aldolase/epimerase/oxygenase